VIYSTQSASLRIYVNKTVTRLAQAITAAEFVAQNEAEVEADVRDLLVLGCISIIAAPRALVPCDVDQHVFWI